MKISILVVLIVLPMFISLGLYCYSFISDRWSHLDHKLIKSRSNEAQTQGRLQKNSHPVKLRSELIRHAFRSRYGLFGYCLDYQWINLLTIETDQHDAKPFCDRCNQTLRMCRETGCCMKRCDSKPDCPSYIDEKNCKYERNRTEYYWENGNCIWHSTWIGNQDLPRSLTSHEDSPQGFHYYVKRIRYYIMFLLFVAAPLFTFLALLIMLCISCVDRFYSIPFAFVSVFSFASFLSGAGALGLFLYGWVQERLHRPHFTYDFDQTEALILALNPWLIEAEKLGLGFWLTVAAIGTTLFTTLLSCCFCCGLQSEKSKLRFHVDNDVYEIVQMSSYD